MKRHIYVRHINLMYDSSRPRAPWSIDGIHHMNGGNRHECEVNDFFGYGFRYDTKAVPFDEGSDIEELKISVKSDGCSLACVYRNDKTTAKTEIIAEYFERVHSTRWIYVIGRDNHSELYEMNATEFKEFVEQFGGLSKESGKTYYKIKIRTTQKMEKWLMTRV